MNYVNGYRIGGLITLSLLCVQPGALADKLQWFALVYLPSAKQGREMTLQGRLIAWQIMRQ
ncbi:MAG: hypothetical protein WC554_16025 [Clostridia bacterium]